MTLKFITMVFLYLTSFHVLAASDRKEMSHDEAVLWQIITDVERGWETADGAPFRKHFLDVDSARYIESGGQNEGLDDLIFHHVEPEADSLADLDLAFSNPEFHISDQQAWVIVDTEISATVRRDGRQIHNRGFETFIFERINEQWKVVHTHSSSRPVKKEEWH